MTTEGNTIKCLQVTPHGDLFLQHPTFTSGVLHCATFPLINCLPDSDFHSSTEMRKLLLYLYVLTSGNKWADVESRMCTRAWPLQRAVHIHNCKNHSGSPDDCFRVSCCTLLFRTSPSNKAVLSQSCWRLDKEKQKHTWDKHAGTEISCAFFVLSEIMALSWLFLCSFFFF